MSKTKIVSSNKTIGIIGGGQLGKMISIAASKLGYRTHVFALQINDPAINVTSNSTVAKFSDKESLISFAKKVDVVTWEFENIPCEVIDTLMPFVNIFPGRYALYISQNRLREKEFINQVLDIPVVRYSLIKDHLELRDFIKKVGYPVVIKTIELGYDGRGQFKIYGESDLKEFIFFQQSYIVEQFIRIKKEISLIVAVDAEKKIEFFPISENYHVNGILDRSVVPADVNDEISNKARKIAKSIAFGLDLVGILTVEFFLLEDNSLLVNEIAPRPHNSGHWTLDACNVNQFEQLVRVICDIPLKPTKLLFPCIMKNILGKDILNCSSYLEKSNASLYIYGKENIAENRKMAHVNIVTY